MGQGSLTVLDLFCGAGGFSLGFLQAGFHVLMGIDFDEDAIQTYRRNHGGGEGVVADISALDPTKLPMANIIIGGPPCQPFSAAGHGLGHEDVRDCVPDFVKIVGAKRPCAFIMENVEALSTLHNNYFQGQVGTLRGMGYTISHKILNSANFGVPQARRRCFVIGTLPPILPRWPTPTHSKGATHTLDGSRVEKYLGGLEALGGVEGLPNHTIPSRRNPPPIIGRLWKEGRLNIIRQGTPSRTIIANFGGWSMYGAYLQDNGGLRYLSPREGARLQGFPDNFIFGGPLSAQYKQIGNAVPPPLAKALAEALKAILVGKPPEVAQTTGTIP